MNLAALGALMGGGNAWACGAIIARSNSLGRNGFGDLFLVYMLKTSNGQRPCLCGTNAKFLSV